MTALAPRFFLPLLLTAAAQGSLLAQIVISAASIQTTAGSAGGPVTTDETNYTFNNAIRSITSFSTDTITYQVSGVADQAFVRRNGVNNNQSSVWYARTSPGVFAGPHVEDYGRLLLGNNLNLGSDNTFANGNGAPEGNIERLDFVYSSSLTANSSMGFAVFDRGVSDIHDAFKISLITGWDGGASVPTAYSQLVSKTANWTPAININTDLDYTLFRYNTGNDLSSASAANETGTQGIGGVVFTLADFNVAPGTPIYGYSLFGFDVTDGGDPSNLIAFANPTYFPTNTNGETGSGGIDLAAVNGITFTAIPEPSTWALGGLSVVALAIAASRRRQMRVRPLAGL